ncbi:RDD family protein [Mycobacterium sp.]|uniref:RDD family protein n=1 Tax=Mycobacterium sp. TaxID=1785 RepID=UPI002B958D99|nr:RDD family protein [Mycobacterium sp.]HTH91742.1 RDD family protein [Mycobacterium sp.]
MTAVLDAKPETAAEDSAPERPTASWLARTGAFSIDMLLGDAVIVTMALLTLSAPQRGWLWWTFTGAAVLVVVLVAVNRLLLPTITGWSLGRALFGIAVRKPDGSPVGLARLVGRDLAHLVDTAALFIGWLWPLWDRRRRTFADLLLRTEVLKVDPPQRDMRRPVAVTLIAATLLCAAGAGLSYLVVYRHDRANDAARAQIASEGPRIVEQMLSYDVDTLQQDFSHAQSLTTDAYRPQLIAQQQAVQRAGATKNEYWAVSSAVLSTPQETADHMSMLLAMQGQRGTDPKDLKFITATVRVDFDRSRDGQWRVANLTVLKKPQMNTAGQ